MCFCLLKNGVIKALLKLKKLSHFSEDVDLIDGRLVNLLRKQQGGTLWQHFQLPNVGCLCWFVNEVKESKLMILNSLTKVSNILGVSAQRRKLVRLTICSQITQYKIWTGALEEILTGLRSVIDYRIQEGPSKEIKMAQQIVATCLKSLNIAISYDPESTSGMRIAPKKVSKSDASHKWEDVLEMMIILTLLIARVSEGICFTFDKARVHEGRSVSNSGCFDG
ncbi:hypothetical protein ACH5RR_040136 [Cinchona calisaya]|uniref:Uncharacterized protein n=1 Tax=Cinchona calisaya TaxID=153742 RepID=A0ABD2XW83_9GENT